VFAFAGFYSKDAVLEAAYASHIGFAQFRSRKSDPGCRPSLCYWLKRSFCRPAAVSTGAPAARLQQRRIGS